MGPEEADPTESRPTDVPLRAVPRLLQGGEGLQREVQVPLQDEDAGESSSGIFQSRISRGGVRIRACELC